MYYFVINVLLINVPGNDWVKTINKWIFSKPLLMNVAYSQSTFFYVTLKNKLCDAIFN